MSNYAASKMKAADLLLKAQAITIDQHISIEANVKRSGERAEEVIIDAGVMSEAELLRALSGAYRTHFVSTDKLSKAEIPRATVQMVPRRVAETLGVFPVMFDAENNVLSVVTADPDNESMLREIQLVSGAKQVKAFVTRPAAVSAAILKHHVVSGWITSNQLGRRTVVTTLAGDQLVVRKVRVFEGRGIHRRLVTKVTVDGVRVFLPDVKATNGVIHVIGGVLLP